MNRLFYQENLSSLSILHKRQKKQPEIQKVAGRTHQNVSTQQAIQHAMHNKLACFFLSFFLCNFPCELDYPPSIYSPYFNHCWMCCFLNKEPFATTNKQQTKTFFCSNPCLSWHGGSSNISSSGSSIIRLFRSYKGQGSRRKICPKIRKSLGSFVTIETLSKYISFSNFGFCFCQSFAEGKKEKLLHTYLQTQPFLLCT